MKTNTDTAAKGTFEKVDKIACLYRYSANGVYYALCKHEGKQVRKSLQTDDKITAKRLLADFQKDLGKVDAGQGRTTLKALCERYLKTQTGLAKRTLLQKTATVNRFLAEFPLGNDVQVSR